MEFTIFLISVIWFLIPAGIANMVPVLVKKIRFLNYPVDFNKRLFGKAIFGSHKTYRGFFFGTIFAIIFVWIQVLLYPYFPSAYLVNYHLINPILLGFLLGFGALFGDLVKSFFKRQIGVRPGISWIPFDQIDWIVGALVFCAFYVPISFKFIIASLLIFGVLHVAINYAGYLIKIKRNKF